MKLCTSRVLLGSLLATFLVVGGLGCELIASVDRDEIYDGTGGSGGSPPVDSGADTKPPDSGKDATPDVGQDAPEDVATEDVATEDVATEDVEQDAADDVDTDAADDAADDVDTDAADDAADDA